MKERAAIKLNLTLLPELFAVCRLSPDAEIPDWANTGAFFSITRTADELSMVCRQSNVPVDVRAEKGWRCLQVAGPLDFALTGILTSLLIPLTEAGISIFTISTFDTDYLLIKEGTLEAAITALRAAGHSIKTITF